MEAYGYNRDRKKGKKQAVLGVICDGAGCPIWRGMVTHARIEELEQEGWWEQFSYIPALTRQEMMALVEDEPFGWVKEADAGSP